MKTILLAPDSFKGTLSAETVCAVMERAIRRRLPEACVRSIPAADGGEGTARAFALASGGTLRACTVSGPYGEPTAAEYALLPDGTAVIEMAACAGLPLVGDRKDPEQTTTFGVGQLLLDALEQGAKRLQLGLGGSATNDGGCGAACACGVRFLDEHGQPFTPVGGTLHRIASIDASRLDGRLKGCAVTALCDIDNPLCGPEGAAAVFGPQKGADAAMVSRLDEGLRHLAAVWQRDLGVSVLELPGGGAAGGMGAGMRAFFGAELRSGLDALLDAAQFDDLLQSASLVLTGEGRLDGQTRRGKVVSGVARRAKACGVPVVAVVGGCEGDLSPLYEAGLTAVFPINRLPLPLSAAAERAEDWLDYTVDNVLRLLEVGL